MVPMGTPVGNLETLRVAIEHIIRLLLGPSFPEETEDETQT